MRKGEGQNKKIVERFRRNIEEGTVFGIVRGREDGET
jgi:hypothetical protein